MPLSHKDFKAGIKLNWVQVNNLRITDDIDYRSGPELKDITTQIDETSGRFGLMPSKYKEKLLNR